MCRVFCSIFFVLIGGCSKPEQDKQPEQHQQQMQLTYASPLGTPIKDGDHPTISHVRIVDLDQDGYLDVLICDVLGQQVSWARQDENGSFSEHSLVPEGVNGPVHAEAVDIDDDGDLDVLVAAMGVILPTDARLGQVIILENDGSELFTKHVIAEGIQRVTDVQAGDFDGDGDLDLAVAQFGYTQGQVQWFENQGGWNFSSHQLIDRSGAIHAPVVDIDNDGDLDVLALISQEWETVYAFVNDGSGEFTKHILHDVADADFSSSGITVSDLDQDGDMDVVWTNGDAFVAVDYRPLPTHGLQWLENNGDLNFTFHRIGQMDGAYGPSVSDMDGDGDLDIITVAEFAFWDQSDTRSVVWWEQQADMQFVSHTIATSPTHLVTCAVGDLDGNGFPDIVAGGMALYPPFDRITRVTYWLNEGEFDAASAFNKAIPPTVQSKLDQSASSGERGMVLQANGLDPRNEYAMAIETEPLNAKWPYFLGVLNVSVGDSESALEYFEQAEKLDATYAPLQTRLGELYLGMGDVDLANEKFHGAGTDYAIVALAQIAASEGNWSDVVRILDGTTIPAAASLKQRANATLNNEQHEGFAAIDMGFQMSDPWLVEMESLCVLAPELVTQAQTDFIAGDVPSAEKLLRRAIAIDAADKDARLALANILLLNDRITTDSILEAILHLETGLRSDPTYVMTRSKYGWALYLSREPDRARAIWLSILEDEPRHGPSLSYLGQLALQRSEFEQSYEYYKRAFDIPEDSPFAISTHPLMRSAMLYRFALSAKGVGNKQEAITALQSAVEMSPSDADIQFELGNMLISQEEYLGALSHIEIANALQPDNPRILAALGYNWFRLGEHQNALVFLQQSIELAPKFAIGWYHLGNAQLAAGDMEAARDCFTIATQLQPTFTAAKEALSKLEGR